MSAAFAYSLCLCVYVWAGGPMHARLCVCVCVCACMCVHGHECGARWPKPARQAWAERRVFEQEVGNISFEADGSDGIFHWAKCCELYCAVPYAPCRATVTNFTKPQPQSRVLQIGRSMLPRDRTATTLKGSSRENIDSDMGTGRRVKATAASLMLAVLFPTPSLCMTSHQQPMRWGRLDNHNKASMN